MVNLEQVEQREQETVPAPAVNSSAMPLNAPSSLNAAHVRVTPEELSRALSAVEARREESSKHLSSTIAIGEAVEQLGLQVTPEELLAEVVEQRAQALRTVKALPRKQIGMWQRRAYVAALCLCLVTLLLFFLRSGQPLTPPAMVATPELTIAPPGEYAALPSYPYLAEVPDGQAVQCDYETLRSLARGADHSRTRVDSRGEVTGGGLWTIVKHNGDLFVKCFAQQAEALAVMNGKQGVVLASEGEAAVAGYVGLDVAVSRFREAQPEMVETPVQGGQVVKSLKLPAR